MHRDLLTRASFTRLPVSTRGCVICAHVNAGSGASGDCACNAGYMGPNGGTCTAEGFFDASVVRYPSSYTYSLDATRTLTPVPGYSPGTATFSAIDISATISSDCKYEGGVLGPYIGA